MRYLLAASVVLVAVTNCLASLRFVEGDEYNSATGCADMGAGGLIVMAGGVSLGLLRMKSGR